MESSLDRADADPSSPPAFDATAYPRTYRARPAMRVVSAVQIVLAIGICLRMFSHAPQCWHSPWLNLGIPTLLLLSAVLGAVELARMRVVLHVDRIEHVTLAGSHELRVDDIESWRGRRRRYVDHIQLQPFVGRGRAMELTIVFETDVAWHAWLGRLRSPDDEDRRRTLERVMADARLGAQADDRVRVLRLARGAIFVVTAGLLFLVQLSFAAPHYADIAVPACLVLPVVALLLAGSWPTLLTLQVLRRADIRASLTPALFLAALAALVVAVQMLPIVSFAPLLVPAIVIGALAMAAALAVEPTLRQRRADIAIVAIPLLMYGGALGAWLDDLLPPREQTRAVVALRGSPMQPEGRRGTRYQVLIGPAPATTRRHAPDVPPRCLPHAPTTCVAEVSIDPPSARLAGKRLDVTQSVWESLQAGAAVCLEARRGMLGVTEATIAPCD